MSKSKLTENELQQAIVLFLRKAGWTVIITAGAWRAQRGMTGVYDLLCHRKDHTLYIEVKSPQKKEPQLRPTQIAFMGKIVPHAGDHLELKVFNNWLSFHNWYCDRWGTTMGPTIKAYNPWDHVRYKKEKK